MCMLHAWINHAVCVTEKQSALYVDAGQGFYVVDIMLGEAAGSREREKETKRERETHRVECTFINQCRGQKQNQIKNFEKCTSCTAVKRHINVT